MYQSCCSFFKVPLHYLLPLFDCAIFSLKLTIKKKVTLLIKGLLGNLAFRFSCRLCEGSKLLGWLDERN